MSGRNHNPNSVLIKSGGTVSEEIPLNEYVRGGFGIPAGGFTGASVSFQVAEKPGGTFTALHNAANTVISQNVTAGKSYAMPVEAMGFGAIKIVSASAEAADRTILISLKA